jgi:gas vesicle protein
MMDENGRGSAMGKGNGYDAEVQDSSAAGFITGLFTGALIGAGLGLLFAPRAGAELRGQIASSATSAGKTVADKYQQASRYVNSTVDQLSTRGRQAFDQARSTVSKVGEEAGRMADEAMETGAKVFSAAAQSEKSASTWSRS